MAASNADVVARERSGHTAVVSENTLFVWGGYVSVADHEVFLPNNEIWLYDLHTGLWKRCDMSGEVPPSMSGTCGCNLNGTMYIFGGCSDDGQTNEQYSVNLYNGKYAWKKLRHCSGLRPSPRDKLSCWVHKGRIIYFGGYGHKLLSDITNPGTFIVDEASWAEDIFWGWNSEVHVFDPVSKGWTEPQTFGHAPAPRAAHASATIGNKGYVCGGRIMDTRKCDLHCLDLNTWMWSEIVPTSTLPLGRSWHTLNAVSDTALFLFGGLSVDCTPMSDGWMFDLKTNEWTEIKHSNMDKPRLWHTACLGRDSDVVLFGGSHDYILLVDSGHCNDTLVFQTQPYSLIRLCEDFIASSAKMFQTQLASLPPKLRCSIQNRITFFRSTRKSSKHWSNFSGNTISCGQ
ncbi:kelch domain-containing protein 1 isoform X1 [Ictalurus punctatus]|uniref:Kelch domain-containing protein 1 isoform X1 n=3 Tax=Ictalurus punctatus TaxID=7998 RepID=A0A2D0RML7_ICTPU|nr:kelch domain-containing protein 1 isoform X1 [Ictalurus punctatus]XP_017331759.1 kelch domain-containing protein 1 isoform X1 [Ictalurus punctatus]